MPLFPSFMAAFLTGAVSVAVTAVVAASAAVVVVVAAAALYIALN